MNKGVRLAIGDVGGILNSDDSCFMYCEDFDFIHCIHHVAKTGDKWGWLCDGERRVAAQLQAQGLTVTD